MAEMQSNSDDIDNQFTEEVSDEYFMNIKSELGQVDRLISDAVNNLVINFCYISKLTKTHHEMVLLIEKMASPAANKSILELLNKQMGIADEIEKELEMIITSLQFGDLVTQLLAHVTHQVEMLNVELQRVDKEDNWKNEKIALHTIHEEIIKAVNSVKAKNNRKPVVQQGMQMGDIELF